MDATSLLCTLLLLLSATGFALPKALPQYQSLVLTPLSKPPPIQDLLPSSQQDNEEDEYEDSDDKSALHLTLHHRDSFPSSLNQTPQSLLHLRLHRDALRAHSILTALTATLTNNTRGFSSSVVSGLSQGSGEYFTRLGVGTPPKYSYMVLDTGSDIVWLQCAPCRKCYSQTDPVFNPAASRSFSPVPCGAPLCRKLDVAGCNLRRRSCLYQVSYGDGSFTVGDFSTETLTFRGTKVADVAFGCGHDNEGLFVGAAGLLGLGRGRLSFPSQAGRRFGRRFSYCLIDRTSAASARPSSIIFGGAASPRSAVFTPMLANPKLDTFYYLGLLGISVGGSPVRGITESMFRLDSSGNGGVIIDSGTSVTRLTRPAYVALRDAFRAGTTTLKSAPEFSLFDTCYDLSGRTEVKVPTVVMHFGGGADVSLPAANYLIPVNTNGIFCFAFAGTTSGLSIIGNIQQQGFRVVFDSDGSRVGFAPRGCA
ncbi:hypothetical protein Scep_006012 [Stephania cephalantha]|uniref:Peptidase A1 domain-containing protein n=1 Tax=Stephania cephalantha TaxID=152367 RepID=A0AAP0K9W1_9MAGN